MSRLPFGPPLAPMLGKLVHELPEAPGMLYEPKWDGFRALAFAGDEVVVQSRQGKDLSRYFPEIVEMLRASCTERGMVLDGEIIVVAERGLDFASLMQRLHPSASRVARLRVETPAVFVSFDLLADGEEDLRERPFAERRARLVARLARESSPHLVVTPQTPSPERAARWFAAEGGGLDGVMAKDPNSTYAAGKRTLVKVKRERTAECVVAGLRLGATRDRIGALLLGMFDDAGKLVHVGVASQLTMAARVALARELAPLLVEIDGHPWEHGFNLPPSPLGRLAGAAGRWTPDTMVRDWLPLRPSRVCEVTYTTVDDVRFRYPARFLRWRPDRDPSSCLVDQLEGALPDVRALLAS